MKSILAPQAITIAETEAEKESAPASPVVAMRARVAPYQPRPMSMDVLAAATAGLAISPSKAESVCICDARVFV